ncbi:DUF4199 domain-containing protein [Aquimarina algiphila]|uniref:DUF4199 domain-containing protein n=1 Tax=Aquimarina algiphila TaxID=2047982 RepID=UPI00232B0306|nr:DUF4199 domain-containing protein [Aquimarina algiphila]
MEETTISTKNYILNYGLILGIAWIIYGFVRYITGNAINSNWTFLIVELLIHLSVIIYGIHAYKLANNGFLELKKALKVGVGIAFIGVILAIFWKVILAYLIEPDLINQIVDARKEEIIQKKLDLSEEDIQQNIALVKKLSSPLISSILVFISNIIFGFIIALFAGAILQKNRDVY